MRKEVLFVVCLAMVVLLCGSCDMQDDEVWICTGPEAYVWHKTRNCRGLNDCSGSIVKRNVNELGSKYQRKCKICY